MTAIKSAGMEMKKGTGQPHKVASVKNNRYIPVVIFLLLTCMFAPQYAWPEQAFQQEFDDVCSRTADSAALSVEDLKGLIARCDKLQTMIEKVGGTEGKIYLKRLRMCRELFVYMLESKKQSTDTRNR
jgi:hypothetical protein